MPEFGHNDLPQSVLSKVDDALNWWGKAKEASRKAMRTQFSTGPGLELKKQCQNKLSQMFEWSAQLEQMKLMKTGDLQQAKTVMGNFAKGLLEIQDLLKALQAMV